MRPIARYLLLALVALTASVGAPTPATAQQPPTEANDDAPVDASRVHAVLINGGASPRNNFLSHLEHLQEMRSGLVELGLDPRQIDVFNADGSNKRDDLATRDADRPPTDFWLLDGTEVGGWLRPRTTFTNTEWTDVDLKPATYDALRDWFRGQRKKIKPGETLLIYVTDHGQRGEDSLDNGTISLWNETMSVLELRALLGYLRPGVRVVMMMSQCYSGSFAAAMYPLGGELPSGDVCGYFATTADRQAYGCYPEGRAHQRVGHAFTLIDALRQQRELAVVHDQVTLADSSPDVPLRTTDLFLEDLLQRRASEAGVPLDDFADQQLARAWSHRDAWNADLTVIDDLAQTWGLLSPRYLRETTANHEALDAARQEFDKLSDRWQRAFAEVQSRNLADFLAAPSTQRKGWSERLDLAALRKLPEPERLELRDTIAPALAAFTRRNPMDWQRLQLLHGKSDDAADARYRMDIRGAINLRIRARLLRIAGLTLLQQAETDADAPQALQAFQRLEACEAAPLGQPKARPTTAPVAAMPALHKELATLERLRPAWLGVRYGAPPAADVKRHKLSPGAALVREVSEGSAAEKAGLRVGDIVLGDGRRAFGYPDEIRDYVMTADLARDLPLQLLRDGRPQTLRLSLRPFPTEPIDLWSPLPIGAQAPALPDGATRPAHVRLFLDRSCPRCEPAATALVAWSARSGVPVVVIVDADTPAADKARGPNTTLVKDADRDLFERHGINGSPTFVAVDETGKVRFRQVGYRVSETLVFDKWRPKAR